MSSTVEYQNSFEAGLAEDQVVEQTPPGEPASVVEVVTDRFYGEGSTTATGSSLRCFAGKRAQDRAAKANLVFGKMEPVLVGDVFTLSGWFWFPDNDGSGRFGQHRGRFLMDLECGICDIPNDSTPGLRLQVTPDAKGVLHTNTKWPSDDKGVKAVGVGELPLEEWVKIAWRITMGRGKEGRIQVRVNDEPHLDGVGTTIYPADLLGLDKYNRLQVGLTANGETSASELWVDDVLAEVERG